MPRTIDERELDAVAGRVAGGLLTRSHLLPPGTVAEALAEAAQPLGISGACIYLADLEQRDLRAMPGSTGQFPVVLAIDSTIAGRAYRTISIHHGRLSDDATIVMLEWMPDHPERQLTP